MSNDQPSRRRSRVVAALLGRTRFRDTGWIVTFITALVCLCLAASAALVTWIVVRLACGCYS